MANLLVLMEFNRGALLPVSLEALGQARRLGSALGLTVYALVPLPEEPGQGDTDITARCGRFGADKVLLLTGDRLFAEQEMRYETFADAVMAACSLAPPRLLFMGDTPAARDLAPRLASRLGAAYLPAGAAFAEEGTLQICDQHGRHLDLTLELDVSEDQPPLTIPVVITVPAGRHRMSWGLHDAELLIVPPDEENAQTIPNLANLDRYRSFLQEAFEPVPPDQRVLLDHAAASLSGQAPLWRLSSGVADPGAQAVPSQAATPWHVHVGAAANPDANYQLMVSPGDVDATLQQLQELVASHEPVFPVGAPGPKPPARVEEEQTLAMFSQDAITAAEEEQPRFGAGDDDPWDFTEDTLSGDEATTARIRSVVGDVKHAMPALAGAGGASGDAAGALHSKPMGAAAKGPASSAAGAAMWEGVSSLPGSDGFAGGDDDPAFEFVSADTAPVPVQAPSAAAQKKEGR